jgi:hypothetical protein
MAVNKLYLEPDGLVVGATQLVASGGGVTVGQNLAVAGNVFTTGLSASGNLSVTGTASFSGNVTAVNFIGSGQFLTGLPASYSNVQVATYLPTYNGNITAGNVNGVNSVHYSNIGTTTSRVYQFYNSATNSLDTVFG